MRHGSLLATILLGLIAVTHLLRLAFRVPLAVGDLSIPLWASVAGALIPGVIAFQLWRERSHGHPAPGAAPSAKYSALIQDGKEELSAYLEYNKVLRSWFVAFGVGGPALFLINAELGKRLAASGQLKLVSAMFLIGAGSQVVGALINKTSNWYVYRGARDPEYQKRRRYLICRWVVVQYWFDVVVDVSSLIAFGVATWRLFTVFGSG